MKKKFSILRVIGLFLIILALYVTISLGWGLYTYMEGTPKITPYEGVKITAGQVVTVDELALVERSHGKFISAACWESGDRLGISVAEDGSSFTVTEGQGVLEVYVYARKGDNGEDRDAKVTVLCE